MKMKMKMSRASSSELGVICASFVLAFSLFTPPAIAESPNAEGPNAVIEEAAMLLDESISGRREELAENKQALYALIDEIMLPRFDKRLAAQRVLAKHWRKASAEERKQFISAFYNHMMQQYAVAVLEFNMERLKVLPFRGDITKKLATVKTFMSLDDGTKVSVNYGMIKRDKGWLMYNVTIEGISYVRTFRQELNPEIQRKGLSGVIARLESSATGSAAE